MNDTDNSGKRLSSAQRSAPTLVVNLVMLIDMCLQVPRGDELKLQVTCLSNNFLISTVFLLCAIASLASGEPAVVS